MVSRQQLLLMHLGFAALIAATVYLSDQLIQAQRIDIAPIWPPAGVAYACMVLLGYRGALTIAAGLMLGHWLSPVPIHPQFLIFALLSNVLGATAGVFIARHFARRNLVVLRLHNGLMLTLGGITLGLISASVATFGAWVTDAFGDAVLTTVWWNWMVGDFFGMATCTNATLALGALAKHPNRMRDDIGFARYGEKLAWLITLVAVAVFWLWISNFSTNYALAFTFMPLILLGWSALRFDYYFTAVSVMVITITIVVYLGSGQSGIVTPSSTLDSAIVLLYFSMLALLPMFVAAASFNARYLAAQLSHRAMHDHLTGLPNRIAFEEMALKTEEHVNLTGRPAALCYLDLDNFKVVNDTCGHAAGDELLAQISHVFESELANNEFIARLGGDEFGLVLPDCDIDDASERINRLVNRIDEFRFVWRQRIFAFTTSAGIAMMTPGRADYTKILSEADAACFEAKEEGGNRLVLGISSRDDHSGSAKSMHRAVEITEALERNRFELYCQQIVPLAADPAGASGLSGEVLLRMRDAQGQLLGPEMFFPSADRFRLTSKIDRWVINKTIQWLDQHPSHARQLSSLSINLSGISISDPSFSTFLLGRLEDLPIPSDKLCFEITETVAIGELSVAAHFIEQIRAQGCRFALDDFGSGLSSFGYLKALHVDALKIDGTFIREMLTNRVDLAMVKSINEVAQVMGKVTVAEYVEDIATAGVLTELGVDYGQGYAFGYPVPINAFFENNAHFDSMAYVR